MERTIRVTGKGRLSVKPDQIRLNISVEDVCPEYEASLRMSTEMTELIKDLFEKLGFDRSELKTTCFDVNTKYEGYQDKDKSWKQRFIGYRFIHRMKIEFDADNKLLGKVLYALAHCSAKPEFSIEYTVSDPEKYKNDLLSKAVNDSKTKASVLTSAVGVRLGEILNIDYSWGEINFVSRPVEDMLMMKCQEECCEPAGYDIDIEADDIDVTDTVTVVWSIQAR